MQDSPTILLVDDEDAIQKLLSFPLQKDGYRVIEARDGEAALRRFDEEKVDLVVLDLALPKLDGLEVCRRLRAHSAVPIIMLTARDEEIDKVIGLEIGADDYITKPFSIREFRSRVRALLRRATLTPAASAGEALEVGPLRVDRARRRIEVDDHAPEFTYVEFELVRILAEHPGRVFSRAELLEKIWGSSQYRDPRTVDVHVRHIREKIERDPGKPELILTVRGVGYRLREP
jgi:DNA-binding response OmpR family regulator